MLFILLLLDSTQELASSRIPAISVYQMKKNPELAQQQPQPSEPR